MKSIYKLFVFFLITATGLVAQMSACLASSYERNKTVAYCSGSKACPPDTTHCHPVNPQNNYGNCCLGCGPNSPVDPKRSCRNHAECNSSDKTKLYRCKKPMFNGRAKYGVCCELKGY